MPRKNLSMDMLIPGKIRKRGCSSSASSSSSIIQNYKFNKRAILVGKRGRSTTPVPTWKLISSMRSPMVRTKESTPKYFSSQSGSKANKQVQPVSARKLAATLWEMNEIPSPRVKEGSEERRLKKELRVRERVARFVRSGSLPPHLSDPSHSPVSERMERSGMGSRQRGTSSVSHKLRLSKHNARVLDSLSRASLMENGEVEDVVDSEEESAESDIHSIELNMDNNGKSYNWAHASVAAGNSRMGLLDLEELPERKSTSRKGKPPRKGNSLQQNVSDGVECDIQSEKLQSFVDTLDWERFAKLERQMQQKVIQMRFMDINHQRVIKFCLVLDLDQLEFMQVRHDYGDNHGLHEIIQILLKRRLTLCRAMVRSQGQWNQDMKALVQENRSGYAAVTNNIRMLTCRELIVVFTLNAFCLYKCFYFAVIAAHSCVIAYVEFL